METGTVAVSAAVETSTPSAEATAAPSPPALPVIPALTPILVEILTELSSKTSNKGETFPLRLAAPIVIDGVELLPAGTPGLGEVIHAKKSGGGGTGGELVLAARFLEVDGAQLPLRSLKFDPTVKERLGTVGALSVASAAVMPAASFLGFLIKGDQMSLPAGSVLTAKTAADFAVARAAPVEPAADPNNAVVATAVAATDTISATGEGTP